MNNLREAIKAGLNERLGHIRMKKENRDALIADILEFTLATVKDLGVGQVNTDSQAVIMTPNTSADIGKLTRNKDLEPPKTI